MDESACSRGRRRVPRLGPILLLVCVLGAAGGQSARIQQVIDGDTAVLEDGRRVRYVGINTPERDQPYFAEATALNRDLTEGRQVRLEADQVREDGYSRLLAYVYVDGQMVNARLIEAGLAHLFVIPPNLRYYDRFLELQRQAQTTRRGMWQSVTGPLKIASLNFNAPGDDRFNPNGEHVRLVSVADAVVNVRGFSLSDAYGHRYTFPALSLKPGYSVLLVSGRGTDLTDPRGPIILYWQSDGPIWNNDGDTATLRDPGGSTVDTFRYRGFQKRKQQKY